MPNLVIFPHCDIHLIRDLEATHKVRLTVYERSEPDSTTGLQTLTDVTNLASVDYFSPNEPVGSRLGAPQGCVVHAGATGELTTQKLGTTFLLIRHNGNFVPVRIQVHQTLEEWDFGSESLTVPLTPTAPAAGAGIAHTQVSIYARFSDDPNTGTDRIGDITNHRYVGLTSSGAGTFSVEAAQNNRLRGNSVGAGTLQGSLNGVKTIPVKVVNYAASNPLQRVRFNGNPANMHNILFVGEGFQGAEQEKFNQIVTKANQRLLENKRHYPYDILTHSINVWKLFVPSEQNAVSTGFRVYTGSVTGDDNTKKAAPIPSNGAITGSYFTVETLNKKVGLPLRGESRSAADLKTAWKNHSFLHDEDPSRTEAVILTNITDTLVAAWRAQANFAILKERNTALGFYFSKRHADCERAGIRSSIYRLTRPDFTTLADNGSLNLKQFIALIHCWYDNGPTRTIDMDPRRHPPEIYRYNQKSIGNIVLQTIGAATDATFPGVGQEWVPDLGTAFKKSVGLIGILANDEYYSGTNINGLTMMALGLGETSLATYSNVPSGPFLYTRTPSLPNDIDDGRVDTIAHEFGHSFNLDDEYEDFPSDSPSHFDGYDNVMNFDNLKPTPTSTGRDIDPVHIKWHALVRVKLSSNVLADSTRLANGNLKVLINKQDVGKWTKAKSDSELVTLKAKLTQRQQLPLNMSNTHYAERMTIVEAGNEDEVHGYVILKPQTAIPITDVSHFVTGSVLLVPKTDAAHQPLSIIDGPVYNKLLSSHLPLNQDTDTTHIKRDYDSPVDITGYMPPCKSYKVVGLFEGAGGYSGKVYRSSGACKMRSNHSDGDEGAYSYLCRYLIINRVDPSKLAELDDEYPSPRSCSLCCC